MRPLALALSPHLDDAAFSAGGTLARLAGAGWRVVVATAFTASVPNPTGFALACQTNKGFGPEVDYMALRRAEDAAACAALGAAPVWLDLPEAPHRGYGSAPALFAGPRDDDAIGPSLDAALATLLRERAPDLVLAPQAIGGHVDHVQLVRALDRLAPALPCLWWRDFPYTAREAQPAEPFRDRMAALSGRDLHLSPAEAGRKRESCRAYASQLGFQFGGPDGLDARLSATGDVESYRAAGAPPGALDEAAHAAA